MLKFKSSLLAQFLVVTILGASAVACSSPEQDAEVREEPVETTTMDAQDQVQTDAIDNSGALVESPVMPVPEGHTDEAHSETSTTPMASTEMNTDADMGVTDSDAVIDGTQEEEHLSTY